MERIEIVAITTDEAAALMRMTADFDPQETLVLTIPGGNLKVCDENRWALKQLLKWREAEEKE